MAILSNGKFYGFLCSVKETGQKLANGVKEYVEDFVSGFSGYGWKLWEYVTGKWKLEIDTIVVRETMLVFEMLISKVRAIIGAQAITQGHGKVKSARISDDGTEYLIVLEDEDMSIVTHDFVRCQTFTGDKTKLYHVEVFSVDVETKTLHVPLSEFEQDELGNVLYPPVSGDELVQFGNSQNKARQSAIYMHADETGQPAIDVMFDIDSKSWDGKVKVRVGGDIPNSGGLKGFYCENGMIKGADSNGHTVYCIYPDGTAEFGDGSAMFCTDKSGHIAGGAISWIWNAEKKKCVCTMKDIVLTWDNLSDEAKENLKGEPGKDGLNGDDGINGADGIDGKDGVSLVYRGSLPSHPANPTNGWYYRNTTDKKCYVYQDNAWYVMTVDGADGKDGLDGINGEDGKDGLDIVWKGDSSIPPSSPEKNWAYRDTDNGRVYIYNGTAWALMVADGNDGIDGTDGKDGMRVYITYNDSEEEPVNPTGDGTTEGWHTNSTVSVIWISQKVAESPSTGEWGTPIRFKGKDANLLPWIEKWNGYATELGEDYIVTPKMFSGTKSIDGKLTGIVQGKECLTDKTTGEKYTGLFVLVDDEIKVQIDPVSGKYKFEGEIFATSGEFQGLLKGVSGTFKNLYAINSDNLVKAAIGFNSDEGKLYFEGDMQHQGTYRDPINGNRSFRFLTSDLWCRGEFGHWRMTCMKFNAIGKVHFYAHIYGSGIDTEYHKYSLAGQPVDCLILEGEGGYTIRVVGSPSYKKITVINPTRLPKYVIYNAITESTDTIPAGTAKVYITLTSRDSDYGNLTNDLIKVSM